MARIPYPEDAELPERMRDLLGALPKLNLVRFMAHSPPVFDAVIRLSTAVLNLTTVDPTLRQVAFIRLCAVLQSPYEQQQHVTIARAIGMDERLIAAAAIGSDSSALTDLQRRAARLAEELASSTKPSAATFDPLLQALGPRAMVELVMGIGFYVMQSRVIETFEVDIEDPPTPLGPGAVSLEDMQRLRRLLPTEQLR